VKIKNFDTQWALLHGDDIFINSAKSGRLGYKCIGCDESLEAVRQKKNPEHKSYFRHYDVDENFHCSFKAKQYLERKIERIIIEYGGILLPQLFKYPSNKSFSTPQLLKEERFLKPSRIEAQVSFFLDENGVLQSGANTGVKEKTFHIRPDLTFFDDFRNPILFIEIVITHPINDEKKAKLIEIGIDTVQINITPAPLEDLKKIVESGTTVKWVYNNEEFNTEYLHISEEDKTELRESDEEQKKLLTESLACRRSRIRRLIRRIKRILETKQYRKIKADLQSEVDRIEGLRRSAESRLEEVERAEEGRIHLEFEAEERELSKKEKTVRQKTTELNKRYKTLEARYYSKRGKLKEEETAIRSREQRVFGCDDPATNLRTRTIALSNDIERLEGKRKIEGSKNESISDEERRIDEQLAEFARIETRLEL